MFKIIDDNSNSILEIYKLYKDYRVRINGEDVTAKPDLLIKIMQLLSSYILMLDYHPDLQEYFDIELDSNIYIDDTDKEHAIEIFTKYVNSFSGFLEWTDNCPNFVVLMFHWLFRDIYASHSNDIIFKNVQIKILTLEFDKGIIELMYPSLITYKIADNLQTENEQLEFSILHVYQQEFLIGLIDLINNNKPTEELSKVFYDTYKLYTNKPLVIKNITFPKIRDADTGAFLDFLISINNKLLKKDTNIVYSYLMPSDVKLLYEKFIIKST